MLAGIHDSRPSTLTMHTTRHTHTHTHTGNETMAINDPLGSKEEANVAFVEITYKGWPYAFVCAKNKGCLRAQSY